MNMTVEEAKNLLSEYADGVLDAGHARELEGLLEKTPSLQNELQQLKDENRLLEEALAPLKPSKSARMRLTDKMIEVHRQATRVAEALPERGSRIFRLVFSFFALGGAVLLAQYRPPENIAPSGGMLLLLIVILLFFVGLSFVLFGLVLARTEAKFMALLSGRKAPLSALGVLTLQVFGVLAVLAAFAMYLWMI